jgi:thiamine biosynthesis protein ThiI
MGKRGNFDMKTFISLLSGGLDSPIAAYLMIKKGFKPVFLSFLTSDDIHHSMRNKIIAIIHKLSTYTDFKTKLYFINHDPNLELFKKRCERKLTCILCKRLMIRIAIHIGKTENATFIVTGDILGEQASQTLSNLYAYNDLVKDLAILRPLISFNKLDVIKINRDIGLYEICSQKSASCLYNPQYPETNAKPREVIGEESKMDINNLIISSIKKSEILYI